MYNSREETKKPFRDYSTTERGLTQRCKIPSRDLLNCTDCSPLLAAHATPATAPGVIWGKNKKINKLIEKKKKKDKVQTTSDLQIFGIFCVSVILKESERGDENKPTQASSRQSASQNESTREGRKSDRKWRKLPRATCPTSRRTVLPNVHYKPGVGGGVRCKVQWDGFRRVQVR